MRGQDTTPSLTRPRVHQTLSLGISLEIGAPGASCGVLGQDLVSGWGRAQWEVEGQLEVGEVSGGSGLMAWVEGGRDTC